MRVYYSTSEWFIEGPGFLAVIWFGSSPNPFPLSRQQVISLSQSSCVCCRSSLLTVEVEERVGEESNHTTAEKAWSSINHSILSGRECFCLSARVELVSSVYTWGHNSQNTVNKPPTLKRKYKGDLSKSPFRYSWAGIRHPRIANFQPKNWSGALLHEANYSIFNYLRWEEVVKGRGSRLETNW